jgi:hypothetical protein
MVTTEEGIVRTSVAFLTVFVCVVLSTTGLAQIPNAGFESWTSGEPDGWATSNVAPLYTNVTQSATAHSGSSAVKGEALQIYLVVMAGTIQSGPTAEGFPYSGRPASITGWYQFNSVGSDRFGINVELFKGGVNGTLVAIAASADATTRTSYTQFNVPFVYYSSEAPDTCIAQFMVALPYGQSSTHVGSYFLLDDLAFSGTSDVNDLRVTPLSFALEQNYPNPFNPTTQIRYSIPATGPVRLTVHNLLGQTVATLVNQTKSAGTHSLAFNASGFPSGMYIYRLVTQQGSLTRSMTLVK